MFNRNKYEIKEALQTCFGDRRSSDCLEQVLLMAHPNKGVSPVDFEKRLQVLRSH